VVVSIWLLWAVFEATRQFINHVFYRPKIHYWRIQ
jgi:hypothetical protein